MPHPLPHIFLRVTMLYIPLTRIKKYMSCDNFCKQPSAVLLYSVTGFLLSISFWGHMYRRQTENEFLETAFSATDQTCEKEKRKANWSTTKWVLTGLSRFYLPFWFTINTQERKTGKKQGRPGSIHHVNDIRCMLARWTRARWIDVGEEGPNCQNNTQDHPFEHSTAFLYSRP